MKQKVKKKMLRKIKKINKKYLNEYRYFNYIKCQKICIEFAKRVI